MGKLFFLGHSHLAALVQSYQQGGAPGLDAEFLLLNEPQYQPVTLGAVLNPAIIARLAAAGADMHVSALGGNDHAIIGMLNDPAPFDFVLPAAPDLFTDRQARILPAGMLRDLLAERIAHHLAALAAYRAAVPGVLLHVESPPPVPSAAHIAAHPGVFADKIAARGVAPALLRYKLWRLQSGLYAAACARLGVEFLPVPPAMQDADGMLQQAAWNTDPTHGNVLYGQHVLAQLLQSRRAA